MVHCQLMNEQLCKEFEVLAAQVRASVVEMSHLAKAPHLGSSLSCIDLLIALYWKEMNVTPEQPQDFFRDRFILSKGHAAAALYAVLAKKGYFSEELLKTYCQSGGVLAEHPSPGCVPGVEAATGSLGHGLPLGLGMALAAKVLKAQYRVFVLMSDGECNEGSVWEAAMMAPVHRLGNLTVCIDFNKWQATGKSCEVMHLESLKDKWMAFGWEVREANGHDFSELIQSFDQLSREKTKPKVLIAHTVKGKGVSFMEDDNNWHYRIPSEEELELAVEELLKRN